MVDTPVYALVVNKGGHKFKESDPDAPDASRVEVSGPNFVWIYPKATMEQLALRIAGVDGIGRPVVDKTGLTGTYAIKLTYTPEYRRRRGGDPTGEITIFEAVQQLGLKLQPQNAPVEMLFVDHIEKPTEN
jgi:uncharacterized protein (TIGR03435 family)